MDCFPTCSWRKATNVELLQNLARSFGPFLPQSVPAITWEILMTLGSVWALSSTVGRFSQ